MEYSDAVAEEIIHAEFIADPSNYTEETTSQRSKLMLLQMIQTWQCWGWRQRRGYCSGYLRLNAGETWPTP